MGGGSRKGEAGHTNCERLLAAPHVKVKANRIWMIDVDVNEQVSDITPGNSYIHM